MHFGARKHLKQQKSNCFSILNEQHCMNPKSFQRGGHRSLAANRHPASVTDKALSDMAKLAVNAPAI